MREKKTSIERIFLEALKDSLNVEQTRRRLGLSRQQVRAIIDGLIRLLPPEAGVVIYIDGAARGNPGPAGLGVVVMDSEGRIVRKIKKAIGVATNNVAEYRALIEGLKAARSMGEDSVEVYSDSELVVRQIGGKYAVKAESIKPLYREALTLIKGFRSFRISHIEREKNSLADSLANQAIDGI